VAEKCEEEIKRIMSIEGSHIWIQFMLKEIGTSVKPKFMVTEIDKYA
jgi:hypothetical protein